MHRQEFFLILLNKNILCLSKKAFGGFYIYHIRTLATKHSQILERT